MVRWIKLFGNQYLGFWILGLVLFALQEIPYMLPYLRVADVQDIKVLFNGGFIKMKRVTAIFLAVVLVFAMFGAQAFAAEDADTEAILQEGLDYWFGINGKSYDKESAREAFQRAADAGSADAWYWLGEVEMCGTEIERLDRVQEYYHTGIKAGSALCWYGLGRLEAGCYGFPQNRDGAMQAYLNAEEMGSLIGQIGMGILYKSGYDCEKGEAGPKAQACFEKALESEDWYIRNLARLWIGILYMGETDGIKLDKTKCREYLTAAYEDGFTPAANSMAYLYVEKLRFYQQAFEWAEKAAEAGYDYYLASGYDRGIFGGKDYDLARELHLKGIETGKEAAIHMADLSYNYANGEGVTRDYHEALKWARASLDASGLDLSTANWAADMEKQLENLILS